ncbi:replication initiation factor domain-containing protein [Arenimonas caeni]|uniref:replication initiation factor domain-containing protein n=1 Tax=Arenimonas caeni TaxID=2058085 RepID=UPI0013B05EFD|nr:replication initiation factor domain-containing protein [Arenimonas caeni]
MSAAASVALTPPPAGVLAVPAGEAGTPSSNHGVKSHDRDEPRSRSGGEARGLWDYATLTVPRGALRSKDEFGEVVKRAHGADEDHETAKVLPSDILDWLLPGHALKADIFETKGWQGYKQSARIFAPGLADPVGIMARDGNADTICVSITGSGMFAVDLRRARLALEHYGARITRIDAAFDDLDGEFVALDLLRYDAVCGMFDGGNRPSSRSFVDDLGTGAGSALYVGRKGDKQLNAYEKGKQQGDRFSPWVRVEVRLWSKNRLLPLEMLDSPLGAILGAYPHLRQYLPEASPTRARTMRRQVEARAEDMTDWLRSAAGKSLGALRAAAKQAGATDSEVLDLLTRDGMPSRFVGIPEEVAIYRTAEFLQGAIQ